MFLLYLDMFYIGELYARAFLRKGELHPVEPVIDSSRLSAFQSEIVAFLDLIVPVKILYHNKHKKHQIKSCSTV